MTKELKGMELKNPLNIKRTKEHWLGENPQPRSTVWQDYEDEIWCYREADHIIMRHFNAGRTLVEDVIEHWAPPNENNTEAYVKGVCQRMQMDPKKPLDLPRQMGRLLHAMTIQELGYYPFPDDSKILTGIALDLMPAPKAPEEQEQEAAKVSEPAAQSAPEKESLPMENPQKGDDPSPFTPSQSTVASGGLAAALVPLVMLGLNAAHIPTDQGTALWIGVALSTVIGYLFKGGRAIHTQGVQTK